MHNAVSEGQWVQFMTFAHDEAVDLAGMTDAGGFSWQFAYNGERHVTELVNPLGAATTLVWGGFHRLCVRRDANGHELKLAYNGEGEL